MGVVLTTLRDDGSVVVSNVPCHRVAADVPVEVPGWGRVTGYIAWGGNWFFLIDQQARSGDSKHRSPHQLRMVC